MSSDDSDVEKWSHASAGFDSTMVHGFAENSGVSADKEALLAGAQLWSSTKGNSAYMGQHGEDLTQLVNAYNEWLNASGEGYRDSKKYRDLAKKHPGRSATVIGGNAVDTKTILGTPLDEMRKTVLG